MKPSLQEILIRPIRKEDDRELAAVIRKTLKEFGADKPGTVYYDPTTDHLSSVFAHPGSVYNVALWNGKIMGGGGIYPTEGLPEDTCELVKMYLLNEARGIGLGSLLIRRSIEFARKAGYKRIYLETLPELHQALNTYAKFGFSYIDQPMGNSGHFGCDLWMLKEIG